MNRDELADVVQVLQIEIQDMSAKIEAYKDSEQTMKEMITDLTHKNQ